MSDNINSPSHYVHLDNIECIDVAENFNYTLGNVIKYVWRADYKGSPLDDLRKAQWYLNREIERRENIDESCEFTKDLAGYAALAGEASEKNRLSSHKNPEPNKWHFCEGWDRGELNQDDKVMIGWKHGAASGPYYVSSVCSWGSIAVQFKIVEEANEA